MKIRIDRSDEVSLTFDVHNYTFDMHNNLVVLIKCGVAANRQVTVSPCSWLAVEELADD